MKSHAQVIHFSGYPLDIAGNTTSEQKEKTSTLNLVKPAPIRIIKSIEDWVNNPRNWDERWFCSYE